MHLDIVKDILETDAFDYFLYADPCYCDDWSAELLQLCPDFVYASSDRMLFCNIAFFDIEDRTRLKMFLDGHGLYYQICKVLRALDD